MLADALVERYSRQILLPDVGGRGQERLCATRVTVTGRGTAALFAARLLEAAGLRIDRRDGDVATLDATIRGAGVVRARGGIVATLVGRPCPACADEAVAAGGASDEAAPAAQALGALVAAEAIRVALGLAATGRIHRLDVARSAFEAHDVERTAGCPACAETP